MAGMLAMRQAWNGTEVRQIASNPLLRWQQFPELWEFYRSTAFDDVARWQGYRERFRLYRNTRLIYNPTRRLCDFYAGQVFPGVLSADGRDLADGLQLAIPLSADASPELQTAISQWWQWSNWQSRKHLFVRHGAIFGSVLVEVEDERARGRVGARVVWPPYVTAVDLDSQDNVRGYVLQYRAVDDVGDQYDYRREVTRAAIRTFRDNQPFDFDGGGAERPNPYGFVAAVWAKHQDLGDDYGAPAADGSLGTIRELNSLASHLHDAAERQADSPIFIFAEESLRPLLDAKPRAGSAADTDVTADRQSVQIWRGSPGGSVGSIAQAMDLAQAHLYLADLLEGLEKERPELTLWEKLRDMSTLTGPAAARLMGDVVSRVQETSANYDLQLIKLHQMAVAIGGYCANSGAWGPTGELTRQQQKFLPFGLDSYKRGDLDHTILPRPLVPPTKLERWQESQAKWASASAATGAGVPLEVWAVEDAGWTEEQVTKFGADKLAAIARQQQLAAEDVVPVVAQ